MTFNSVENSNDDGRPIYLYEFTLGAAKFRYTSSDADVTLNGYKWKAEPITDDGVKLTGDANTDGLTITGPASLAPAQMFLGTPPSQAIMVAIYHYHEIDNNSVLAYIGEVMQVNQPQPGTAAITCDTISASMQRDGLRLAWQRNCPYAVYDPLTCKASKATHKIDLTVTVIAGNTVKFNGLAGKPNGHMDGGFIEWEHPTRGTEFRMVEQQIGDTCVMFGLTDGLYYALKVKAYPGCNRTVAVCISKFNNLENYGGIPDLPGKSPFDGDPVF